MTFRVVLTETVVQAIDAQLSYFDAQGAPGDRVGGWLDDLLAAIDSLSQWPERYPVAEIESAVAGMELRKLNFGDYLVFYHVRSEKSLVEVLSLRHGARQRE